MMKFRVSSQCYSLGMARECWNCAVANSALLHLLCVSIPVCFSYSLFLFHCSFLLLFGSVCVMVCYYI